MTGYVASALLALGFLLGFVIAHLNSCSRRRREQCQKYVQLSALQAELESLEMQLRLQAEGNARPPMAFQRHSSAAWQRRLLTSRPTVDRFH